MKLSIIIPVLNSHEVVRRQLLYLERLGISDDTEVIIIDDGSDPPLDVGERRHFDWGYEGRTSSAGVAYDEDVRQSFELTLVRTNDPRPWTWALARNRGADIACGDYLLMLDVDHILSRDVIDTARTFGGQKVQFKREFGVLDEDGVLAQDHETLLSYGLDPERLKDGVQFKPLPNNFAMRADVFWALGGYREDRIGMRYPQGEDRLFKKAWQEWQAAGKGQVHTYRPTLYMFPSGQYCGDVDHNPFGLFHDLSRKTNANHWHRKLLREKRA